MRLSNGLGDALLHIGNWAFSQCTQLAPPRLPPTLQSIGAAAFAMCSSLVLAEGIPVSVKAIGERCFAGCSRLSLEGWSDSSIGVLAGRGAIGRDAFQRCHALDARVKRTLRLVAPDSLGDAVP